MTEKELQTLESELQTRGYRKYTRALVSNEAYSWFKTFHRAYDSEGETTDGYQIAFRVWHTPLYGSEYSLDFWTSPLGIDARTDLTSIWEPIADISIFERLAEDFNAMIRNYITPLCQQP